MPIAGGVLVPIEARDASLLAADLAGQQGFQILVHHVAAATHQEGFGTESVVARPAGEESSGWHRAGGGRIAAAGGGEGGQASNSGCLPGAEQGGGALVLLGLVFRRGDGVADVFIGQADDGVGAGLQPDGPTDGGGGLYRDSHDTKQTQFRPGDGYHCRVDAGRQKARRPQLFHRLSQYVAVQRFHGGSQRPVQGWFLVAVLAGGCGLASLGTPAVVIEEGAAVLGAAGFGRPGHGLRNEPDSIGVAPASGDGFAAHLD